MGLMPFFLKGVNMKIAVIGLGYVGLSTSLVLAKVGYDVVAIDLDNKKIDNLRKMKLPFYEPNLKEDLEKVKSKIIYTTKYEKLSDIKLIFICVGTPINKKRTLDTSNIFNVCESIKSISNNEVIICIRSTVAPNTCKKIEQKLNCPRLKISVNPEFLAQGSAIKDYENSNRIVIGVNDSVSKYELVNLYKNFKITFNNNCPILVMPREDAEMIKFVANSFLATRISFINEIANLCDKMSLNVDNVIDGIKYDKRIGDHYLKYGIGYGGSCLPKDTIAFLNLSKRKKSSLRIIKSTIKTNNLQPKLFLNKLLHEQKSIKSKKIAILGVTYKANTDDVRESPAIYIIKKLLKRKVILNVYDPKGLDNIKKIFKENNSTINYFKNITECINQCDIIIIMTEWSDIINFNFEKELQNNNVVIYDFKVCLKNQIKDNSKIDYKVIGGKNEKK